MVQCATRIIWPCMTKQTLYIYTCKLHIITYTYIYIYVTNSRSKHYGWRFQWSEANAQSPSFNLSWTWWGIYSCSTLWRPKHT
jgi:hypothetical protein